MELLSTKSACVRNRKITSFQKFILHRAKIGGGQLLARLPFFMENYRALPIQNLS